MRWLCKKAIYCVVLRHFVAAAYEKIRLTPNALHALSLALFTKPYDMSSTDTFEQYVLNAN